MAKKTATGKTFNIVIVGQAGRLQYEAILFAASLRRLYFIQRLGSYAQIVVNRPHLPNLLTRHRYTGTRATACTDPADRRLDQSSR